jgi:AcrR family transcriptional regulator
LEAGLAMRYSNQHKQETRRKILGSAYRLFAAKGFDATSIEEIMRDCVLTRGGFYAHFKSKSDLYREAMRLAAPEERLPSDDCDLLETGDESGWIAALLSEYLDGEIRRDHCDNSRLSFFARDVASEEPQVRTAYTTAFQSLSGQLRRRLSIRFDCSEEDVLALTSMIIGALGVAQTIDNVSLRKRLLAACKEAARGLLADRSAPPSASFFWEPCPTD